MYHLYQSIPYQPDLHDTLRLAGVLTRHGLVLVHHDQAVLISALEKLVVCDVTNLPYMDINRQSISLYGYFVTSLTAYYSGADINYCFSILIFHCQDK